MATYIFPQFNLEIVDPEVVLSKITDNMDSTCTIDISLLTDAATFGVTLDGFKYADNYWDDEMVYEWVIEDLKNYEPKELPSK